MGTNNMEPEKSKNPSLSIIRFMELSGFLLAFVLLYVLFERIELHNNEIAILAFLVSLCVIKTDLLFYAINSFRDIGHRIYRIVSFPFRFGYHLIIGIFTVIYRQRVIETIRKISGIIRKYLTITSGKKMVKYVVVLFKQLFFNTSYDLFPIFLIWLIVWGIFYIFHWVTIQNASYLISFITAFTIVLAIFQFFLQRHEEKIFAKISSFPRQIDSIIIQETTFSKFFMSIDNSDLRDKIKLFVDPRISALDLLSRALKDTVLRDLWSEMQRSHTPMPIQLVLNQSYDSDQRFTITESYLETGYKNDLYKAYKKFFLEKAYMKILERIDEEIDVEEFAILAQSNINIIQEVVPDFINRRLQKEFDIMISQGENKDDFIPESSFQQYREHLKIQIFKGLQQKILF
ncbi:MAG: hypothetical protein WC586_06485 [Methanoregula sp.]